MSHPDATVEAFETTRRSRRAIFLRDGFQKTAFMVPTCAFLAALTIWPFIYSVYLSLHAAKLTNLKRAAFIGLDNYTALLTDSLFLRSMFNTALLAVCTITLEILIGFLVAKVFMRLSPIPWANALRSLFLLPMMVTPLVVGMMFAYLFNPVIGIVDYLITLVGLPPVPWFGNSTAAMISILIIDVWQWAPFMMLLILAGLTSIPNDLYEAARVDGAKWHQILRLLEIPSLKSIIMLGVILRVIDTLRFFDIVYVTTRGGPGESTTVLTLYAYLQDFQYFQVGRGSAAAVVILVISIAITTYTVGLLRRIENA